MAIYHCSIKVHSRGKGQSAIPSIAYRAGEKIKSERTGQISDFSHRHGVEYSEIMLPESVERTHPEFHNRAVLWNAVDAAEKQSNARFSREWEVALPQELTVEQMKDVVRDFCSGLVAQGMIVDWSLHQPHHVKGRDGKTEESNNNWHAHISAPTRGMDQDGNWQKKETKVFALDQDGNRIPEIDPKTGKQKVRIREGKGAEKIWKRETAASNGWNNRENVPIWRKAWEEAANRGLEKAGLTERIDCRSLKDQGIERIPTIHEGPAARQIEARGGISDRMRINRTIISANREIQKILDAIGKAIQKAAKAVRALQEALNGDRGKDQEPGRSPADHRGPAGPAEESEFESPRSEGASGREPEPDQKPDEASERGWGADSAAESISSELKRRKQESERREQETKRRERELDEIHAETEHELSRKQMEAILVLRRKAVRDRIREYRKRTALIMEKDRITEKYRPLLAIQERLDYFTEQANKCRRSIDGLCENLEMQKEQLKQLGFFHGKEKRVLRELISVHESVVEGLRKDAADYEKKCRMVLTANGIESEEEFHKLLDQQNTDQAAVDKMQAETASLCELADSEERDLYDSIGRLDQNQREDVLEKIRETGQKELEHAQKMQDMDLYNAITQTDMNVEKKWSREAPEQRPGYEEWQEDQEDDYISPDEDYGSYEKYGPEREEEEPDQDRDEDDLDM